MKTIGRIVALLVSIALLSAFGFGGYLAIERVAALFASLDPEVAIVTAITCLAALTCAWIVARGIRAAGRQNKAIALREEKTATYQLLLDFWATVLLQKGRTDQLTAIGSEKVQLLERMLALYGAASVIGAHTTLRCLERNKGGQHPEVRARLGEVLVAIRNDLGTDTPPGVGTELAGLLLPAPDRAETADTGLHTALAARVI